MSSLKKIALPLDPEIIVSLRAGDRVLITGSLYTARDAAHQKMIEQLAKGKSLPVNLEKQVIYYVGPTPAKPGQVIGSAGPTTSGRMDKYTPTLLEYGLKGMIGKGYRNQAVKKALVKHKAVYLGAVGGSAALISKTIQSSKVVAYPELGTEAIRKIKVKDFPAIVINDMYGNDWYEEAKKRFGQQS